MNPSMTTAFEALAESPTRRPTAPPRDYEARPVEDDLEPPAVDETIAPGLIPVLAAPISKRTKTALRKMKCVPALEAAAKQEDELQNLMTAFSSSEARRLHKEQLAAAIATGNAETIQALPSEAEVIAKNETAAKQIKEKLRQTRLAVMDDLETLTNAATRHILAERAEAVAAMAELFKARNLPDPVPAVIADAYTRRCQELRNYIVTARAGGVGIEKLLVELIG